MTTFPALRPATRSYSFGEYPISTVALFAGGPVRFKHGATAYGHTLQLGFVALTAAQAKLLRDHYREQDGSYTSFPLSAEAWAGHTSLEDLVPATTYWRYASQPEETHRTGGYIDVAISLLSDR